MQQFRIQAALLCMIAVLRVPSLQGQVTAPPSEVIEQVVYQVGVAEAVACGVNSTEDKCDETAESTAITSLVFWVYNRTESGAISDGPVEEPSVAVSYRHLVSFPIKVRSGPEEQLQNVTSDHQDGPAWVSEITCNLVPIKIAKYSGNVSMPGPRKIVGTYDATVSQACHFLVTTQTGQVQSLWFPKHGSNQTRDMTQKRTFTAKPGHQIVGAHLDSPVEVGKGPLTFIPMGMRIVEAPVPKPEDHSTTTTSISAAPPLSANWATVAIATAFLVGSLAA